MFILNSWKFRYQSKLIAAFYSEIIFTIFYILYIAYHTLQKLYSFCNKQKTEKRNSQMCYFNVKYINHFLN